MPALAAIALMSEDGDPPPSMTLLGGPIDTRAGPNTVSRFAEAHSLEWFRRLVYPGFLQLSGFLAMHPDQHFEAHWRMFLHRLTDEAESLAASRRIYDEYFAVMNLPAEYYLATIAAVFQQHLLARRPLRWRGCLVDPGAIERTALFTIEGERDDISGIGQTRATHALCTRLPAALRRHREQQGAGHFDLFSGHRFREEVAPAIKGFIRANA